MTEEMGL